MSSNLTSPTIFKPSAEDAGKTAPSGAEQAYTALEKSLGDKEATPGKRLFEQLSFASVQFIND